MRILSRAVPVLLALTASVPAQAMLAYVDDGVLDSLRGRYIDAGQIVRFGVQMLTTWQNQAGVVQGAGLQLTAQTGAVPVISRYTLNSDGTATTTAATAPTSGLASVQGVVQLNQQAGNGNRSSNSTSIDIRRDGTASLQMPEGWQAGSGSGSLGSGQLAVNIDLGSTGRIGQMLGQGQLLQFSSINGSGISTDNSLRIQLVLQPQAASFGFSIPNRLMLSGTGVR